MTEGFGVDAEIAREIWSARQIMQGARHFDSAIMDRLDALSQVLRAVINSALKDAQGIPSASPPLVAPGGLSVGPHMAVGGTSAIDADDLTPL